MTRAYLPQRDWGIQRPRLDSILASGLEYPLIAVSAAPGYGKTTAVADFCRETDRRLIWMQLLPTDNDSGCFWGKLRRAIQHELPRLAEALEGRPFPESLRDLDDFLRELLQESCRGEKLLLVFDNAQYIESEAVGGLMGSIIGAEMSRLCVICIGSVRSAAQAGVGGSQHFKIGAGELRFDATEAEQLFAGYGKTMSKRELERLVAHTDGWPLALHLIASQQIGASQESGERSYLRVLFELFDQDYYAACDLSLRQCLVKLALLPRAAPELIPLICSCDLERFQAHYSANMFILYDDVQERFYFQRMYREFLLQKRGELAPSGIAGLYAAAGGWYFKNGHHREALECFWRVRDYDSFLEVVLALPRVKNHRDFTNWILGRLNQFPAEYRRLRGEVDFARGFMYLNDARISKAGSVFLALIRRLEGREELPPDQKRLLGNAWAVMIDVSFAQNRLTAMEYLEKASPLLPDGTDIRSDELMTVGNNDVFFLPDSLPGGIEKAVGYVQLFYAASAELYGNSGRGVAQLFAAEAAYYDGRLMDAWTQSVRAFHSANGARMYDIAANALFLQLRINLIKGDYFAAQSLLRYMGEYVAAAALPELSGQLDCARGMFYTKMNDFDQVPGWLSDRQPLPDGIPMDIGRDRITCAACLLTFGRYQRAYGVLLELDELLADRGLWSVRLYALLLKAGCLLHMENPAGAMEALWRAYEMTRHNNIIICFAELEHISIALLNLAITQKEKEFDPVWIATAREAALTSIKRGKAMTVLYGNDAKAEIAPFLHLTQRETEVITYLSQGYSRDNIGTLMGISLHGVKKHIANIYQKLGAVNRVDAIQIAIANGIIDQ